MWSRGCGELALLVAMGAVSTGCGEELPSPAVTIKSDDGKATLEIPEGALPSGVTAAEISVTALTESQAFSAPLSGDVTFVAGYAMKPDGLVLASPATLTVTTPISPGWLITGLLSLEAEPTTLPTTILWAPGSESPRGYSAPIPHFSQVVTLENANVGSIAITAPLTAAIPNGPTSMGVRITPVLYGQHDTVELWILPNNRSYKGSFQWQAAKWTMMDAVFDNFSADTEGLFPSFDGDLLPENPEVPPSPTVYATLSKDITQRFTCKHVGQMSATYRGTIVVDGQATWTPEHGGPTKTEDVQIVGYLPSAKSTADCAMPISDGAGDFVDSISSNQPTYTCDCLDIASYASSRMTITAAEADARYNGADAVYACSVTGDGVQTVCPEKLSPMPPGDVLVFTTTLAAPVPAADPGHSFIFSTVVDSDGLPANNWQFIPPYNWDLFQGADRWYQLVWDHKLMAWTVDVTQVDAQQQTSSVASSARVVIQGSSITWHISGAEITAANPGYRITAFGHDGNFSPSDRGADVSGVDPSQPLTLVK